MTEKYPKKVYQEKMRAYLDELRAHLDKIEEQVLDENVDVDIKVKEPEAIMSAVREVDNKAQDHLSNIEEGDGHVWEDLRSSLETVWDNLMSGLDYLEERLVGDDLHDLDAPH